MAIKWDFNLGTLIPIGGALFAGAIFVNTQLTSLELRVSQGEVMQVQRGASADANAVQLTAAIRTLQDITAKQNVETNNLTYRMGQNEGSIKAANERLDRLADAIVTSVESLRKELNSLGTKVEVMNQKIDSLDVPRMRGTRN